MSWTEQLHYSALPGGCGGRGLIGGVGGVVGLVLNCKRDWSFRRSWGRGLSSLSSLSCSIEGGSERVTDSPGQPVCPDGLSACSPQRRSPPSPRPPGRCSPLCFWTFWNFCGRRRETFGCQMNFKLAVFMKCWRPYTYIPPMMKCSSWSPSHSAEVSGRVLGIDTVAMVTRSIITVWCTFENKAAAPVSCSTRCTLCAEPRLGRSVPNYSFKQYELYSVWSSVIS